MNKFFSRILLLGAFVMMVMTTGCQKDGVVTLRAKINHFDRQGKVILGGDNHRTPSWRNGDKMIVNNNIITLSFNDPDNVPVEVPTASAYWAVFPAGIFSSASDVDNRININLPSLQPYVLDGQDQSLNAPMAAYLTSDNNPLTFSNLGAVLAIQIVNNTPHSTITVDSVTVEATGIPLCGAGYINNIESDSRHVVLTSTSEDDKKVVLAVENTDQTLNRRSVSMNLPVGGSAKTVYVYVPASLYTPNRYRITVHAVAGTEDVSVTHEQSESNPNAGSIPCNSLVDVRFEMGNVQFPTGAVHGYFSVSPTQQVYFSNGNLQYQPSTSTWRFAEHQWDYIGEGNANISDTYDGWIDLFAWGTGDHPTDTSTYMEHVVYANFVDWGVNPISNWNGFADQWWTLDWSDWHYLLYRRNTDSGILYASATVNDIYGLILLPDNWDESVFAIIDYNHGSPFSSNVITESQWEIMERYGAIFLPAAGVRRGATLMWVQEAGLYWIAGPSDPFAYVFYVQCFGGTVGMPNYCPRYAGLSVRLVRDTE